MFVATCSSGELGDYGGKITFNETPISPDSSNSILSTPSTLSTSTPKSSRNPVVDYFKETRLPESMKSFHEDIQLLHKKLKLVMISSTLTYPS